MHLRKLERDRWKPFFDLISKALVGKRAEVAELETGAAGKCSVAKAIVLRAIIRIG